MSSNKFKIIAFGLLVFLLAIFALKTLSPKPEVSQAGFVHGEVLTQDGVSLPYWFYDRGTEQVLVYLHGGPGSNSSATRLAYGEKLSDSLGSVLFFDQRSSGAVEDYNFPTAIQDLKLLVDTVAPDKNIVLWGHSFGATLAVMNASAVNGLPAKAYILDGPWLNESLCQEARQNITAEQTEQNRIEHELMAGYKEEAIDTQTAKDAWYTNEHLNETDFLPKLSNIKVPVLVLEGAWDANVPYEQVEAMMPYLPQGQLTIIAQAGHNALFSHEAEFIEAMKTFLR